MDLSAELTKSFGEEIAKIFAATISEDEIKETAKKVYDEMNKHSYSYGKCEKSELERLIDSNIVKRVNENIADILGTNESKEQLKKDAEEIVSKARALAKERLVERLADGMVSSALYEHNLGDLGSRIAYAITKGDTY